MASTPLFPAGYRIEPYQIIAGMGLLPRIVFRPGANGSDIINVSIAANGAAIENVQWALARLITSAAGMGAGSLLKNGVNPDQINRSAGDFTQDGRGVGGGWRAGQRVLIQDATTLANDAVDVITAVTPVQLQLKAGGGTLAGSEALPALNGVSGQVPGLYRVHNLAQVQVPVNAGTAAAGSAVKGFDRGVNLPTLLPDPDSALHLGPNDFLVAALSVALVAPATLDLCVHALDY